MICESIKKWLLQRNSRLFLDLGDLEDYSTFFKASLIPSNPSPN